MFILLWKFWQTLFSAYNSHFLPLPSLLMSWPRVQDESLFLSWQKAPLTQNLFQLPRLVTGILFPPMVTRLGASMWPSPGKWEKLGELLRASGKYFPSWFQERHSRGQSFSSSLGPEWWELTTGQKELTPLMNLCRSLSLPISGLLRGKKSVSLHFKFQLGRLSAHFTTVRAEKRLSAASVEGWLNGKHALKIGDWIVPETFEGLSPQSHSLTF